MTDASGTRPQILIVAPESDVHALYVKHAIEENFGGRASILCMEQFPCMYKCSWAGSIEETEAVIAGLPGESIDTVWWRRPGQPKLPQWDVNGEGRASEGTSFASAESSEFLEGLLWSLDAYWVNKPGSNRHANRKVTQLGAAQKLGFDIPRTLVCNDADSARAFAASIGGPPIVKPVASNVSHPTRTQVVDESILDRFDAFGWCPSILQEYIEPHSDLRVTCFGSAIHAVEIDSAHGHHPEDSRLDNNVAFEPTTLDDVLTARLKALLKHFDLEYAAIDLRVSTSGTVYFLELNPSGQFAYLEFKTGLPLINEMARLLVDGARPR